MKIQFCGAAQTVTGSRHLLTTDKGQKILLDCGMFQGRGADTYDLNHHFLFSAHEIDAVVLSHAHIDHSGALPRLMRLGYSGVIYATPPTIDLCRIMLMDSAHIQTNDLKYLNQRRKAKGEPPVEPLYDTVDVEKVLDAMKPIDYNVKANILKDVLLEFTDNAHIIGSAAVHLDIQTHDGLVKLTYTGDIGRPEDKILRQPQPFRQPDVLICESTYGNRFHENYEDLEQHLLKVVRLTCVERQGKLIIPAFSIDRTQELIYALDRLEHQGMLPRIPVYIDSPLSVEATHIIKDYEEYFNESLIQYLKLDAQNDAFNFPNLHYIRSVDESKAINELKGPCIIISASGMAEAGRVKHHIRNNIENPRNTILMVGYCTPESLGGRLKAGEKQVRIFGEDFQVKAWVTSIEGYSAHADQPEMISYLSCINAALVKKMFLVHGDLDAMKDFKDILQQKGFENVLIPMLGEMIKING